MSIRQGYFRYGQTVQIVGSFKNGLGELIDPTGVTLTFKKPDNTVPEPLSLTATNSLIVYNFVPDQVGLWHVELACSGPVPTIEAGKFEVVPSTVAPEAE